jgi:hypothetical protein
MESLFVLLLIVQPILIGTIAQKAFRRTGVLWAIVAFGLSLLLGFFLDAAITSQPEWILDPEHRRRMSSTGHDIAFILMSIGISTAITLIVLATLPKRAAQKSTLAGPASVTMGPTSVASELERLASLREREIISEAEFNVQKRKLLEP